MITSMAKRRLGREDWEQAALDALAEGGLAGVAVEPLAARLGVTKGSFYAHFANRDALIEAALARWETSHGAELAQLSAITDPAERLARIMRYAIGWSQSGEPSVHVKLLGELHDPRVRGAVARMSDARVERLTASFRELGFDAARAAHRARLVYALYVGLLQMVREAPEDRLSEREMDELTEELRATVLAPP